MNDITNGDEAINNFSIKRIIALCGIIIGISLILIGVLLY